VERAPSAPTLARRAREEDYERYLLSLFAPASAQPHLWSLLCFAVEIARIPEIVSQEMVGLIRLAWWRERLDEAYAGQPLPTHDILHGIAAFLRACNPPRAWFDAMITARQEQLGRTEWESFDVFERFARDTAGSLAALMSYAVARDEAAATRAADIGTAYGMLGLVRATPAALQRGVFLLPEIGHVYRAHPEALPAASREVSARIRACAEELLRESVAYDAVTRRLQLLGRLWCRRLARAGDDAFHTRLQMPLPFLPMRLWLGR
jgi:phytoene/squalene synthetase